jgi:uncharacterized protein (TIGR02145 family)
MRKIIFLITLLFCLSSSAQVIVTLRSKYLGNLLYLDSIIVENLSQPGRLSLAAPLEINSYDIDLMQGKIINAVSDLDKNEEGLYEKSNVPGRVQILASLTKPEMLSVSLLNMTGKIVRTWNIKCDPGTNMLEVTAGSNQMYICSIKGERINGNFKLSGSGPGPFGLTLTPGVKPLNKEYSSVKSSTGFVFSPGDGVRFTAFKNGMYRNSVNTRPNNLDSLLIYLSMPCPGAPQVTDYDGNTYTTVLIGSQCWMRENIKSKHYANGDVLADGTGVGDLTNISHAKYWFDYDDNPANSETYGRLYTSAAATNDVFEFYSQGICPYGWHVSAASEWCQLEMFLDSTVHNCNTGPGAIGGWFGYYLHEKLCESDTTHWAASGPGNASWATDESGFHAIPSGARGGNYYGVYFSGLHYSAQWWSIGPTSGGFWNSGQQPKRGLTFLDNGIFRTWAFSFEGLSVRCVKN